MGNFIWILFNLQMALNSMAILIRLILPIQQRWVSSHFSKLSLISFINALLLSVYKFCHFLWPAVFLQKTQLIALQGFPVINSLFLNVAFRILSLSFAIFYYNILWCGSVWVYLFWNLLCFLYLDIYRLLQVWEDFSHNFFKYVFSPLFLLLSSLLCVDWHALLYPVGLLYCFNFFFSFGFLSAVLIG